MIGDPGIEVRIFSSKGLPEIDSEPLCWRWLRCCALIACRALQRLSFCIRMWGWVSLLIENRCAQIPQEQDGKEYRPQRVPSHPVADGTSHTPLVASLDCGDSAPRLIRRGSDGGITARTEPRVFLDWGTTL
jgi:hypothetical protein